MLPAMLLTVTAEPSASLCQNTTSLASVPTVPDRAALLSLTLTVLTTSAAGSSTQASLTAFYSGTIARTKTVLMDGMQVIAKKLTRVTHQCAKPMCLA